MSATEFGINAARAGAHRQRLSEAALRRSVRALRPRVGRKSLLDSLFKVLHEHDDQRAFFTADSVEIKIKLDQKFYELEALCRKSDGRARRIYSTGLHVAGPGHAGKKAALKVTLPLRDWLVFGHEQKGSAGAKRRKSK